MFKGISKTVWVLSIISLCTDAASEMLYPVMPVYLKSIGFSIVFIGLLEGIAEAVAGLSKGYFGKLSDVSGKRVPFVQLGYTLSALSKPMLAFFINPIWVFFSRTTDRLGKGIRTGARDALLSDEATSKTKGKIFGFHRSMDTLGAVIGPAIALIYLYFNPSQYKNLFLLAFIPGLLAILSTLFLKQKNNPAPKEKQKVSFFSFLNYWKQSDIRYRKLVIGLLVFALFNSSDVFLLLKVKEAGINDTYVIGIYIFYNLIYSLSAFPMGLLADKLGMKKIFITGLIIFSIVYAGMGITTELWWFVILFLLYGIYAAATEGIAKAWISNISDKKDTATAIGTYTGFQSICSLFASSFTGLIWYQWGSTTAFIGTAVVTFLVIVYFLLSE
jgi:MFS family permease